MSKKALFFMIYFLCPIVPILVTYGSNPEKYRDPAYSGTMILGAAAFTWLALEFILIARPKFIERHFGLDKVYGFHGWMAIISIILVLIHKSIIEELKGEVFPAEFGKAAWILFIAISILALLFMVDSILLKIKPILMLRTYVEKTRLAKFEYQIAVHNLTVIALIIMLVHVLFTSSAKASLMIRLVYFIYFAAGAAFYLYHRIIKRNLLDKNMFVVKELVKESPDMWSLKFESQKGVIFPYKPGQFGFFRIFGGHVKPEEHPFSISSDPSNKNTLSITIKELGDYTSHIRNVQVGDKAHIDAPYGKFSHLNYPGEGSLVLIAGGVGIAPFQSMLRYMRSNDRERRVILLWGVNDRRDLISLSEFEEMQKDMKNFHFVPVMFKDDSYEGEKGIIDRAKIENILKRYDHDIHDNGYYICGPYIMLKNVISGLKSLGVKRNRIHYEKLTV